MSFVLEMRQCVLKTRNVVITMMDSAEMQLERLKVELELERVWK